MLLQIAVLLQQKKTSVSFRKGDEGFLLANFEVFSPRSENHLCFLVFSQENLRKTLKFARRKPSSPFRKEIGVAKDLQFVVCTVSWQCHMKKRSKTAENRPFLSARGVSGLKHYWHHVFYFWGPACYFLYRFYVCILTTYACNM